MITPTELYRRIDVRPAPPLPKGLDATVQRVVGAFRRRAGVLAELQQDADAVERHGPAFRELTDHDLQQRLLGFRTRFRRGGRGLAEALPEALAAIREAAHRVTGMRPFPVQIQGALALHRGCLAEMATGEGKTLTASLAAVLRGWTRRPCHVITVNDYLVQRDAEWFTPLYRFCGVRAGHVTAAMAPDERRRQYEADVTYATSKEVVADFLRDSLQLGTMREPTRRLIRQLLRPTHRDGVGLVLRGLHSAIVDEADSVLIDEAVTPLIISSMARNEALREAVGTAQSIVEELESGRDYTVDPTYREVALTARGQATLARACGRLPGLWRSPLRRFELVRQALVAREFFHRGKQYIVDADKVVIVDEFTGRPMPQRSWRAGLHQAVEAKDRLPLTDPTDTLARISFQRYFRLYHHLAGMTGTAREAADEFWHIYGLPVIAIPSNRPCLRRALPDRVLATEEAKWRLVSEEIGRWHATGRPVLVGTRSVAASEMLGERLAALGLTCRVLNAMRHSEEAAVVAGAGEPGRITIATNMAGRGTDIRLGRGVAELGGLHVIATERHESGRVDRQLFGRAARQGDPGSSQAILSLEDELLRRHLPRRVQPWLSRWVSGKGEEATGATTRAAFRLAQNRAQHAAFRMRQAVLRTDDWLEESLSFAAT